jgi:hypothetical protein
MLHKTNVIIATADNLDLVGSSVVESNLLFVFTKCVGSFIKNIGISFNDDFYHFLCINIIPIKCGQMNFN